MRPSPLPRLLFILGLLAAGAACIPPQGSPAPAPAPPEASPVAERRETPGAALYLPLVLRLPSPTAASSPASVPTPVRLTFCAAPPGGALAIPDGDFEGVTSRLRVDYAGRVVKAAVRLEIAHTWTGDLRVLLRHAGRQARLLERPGRQANPPSGCPQNDVRVVFDDEAAFEAASMCSEIPPAMAGPLRPAEPLSLFAGAPAEGEWALQVSDASRPDRGELTNWCLLLTVQR